MVDADTTSHQLTNLYVGQYYSITVTARNDNGESDPSDPYEQVFANLPSVVPDLIVSSVTDESVTLDWSDANENGSTVTGYIVEWEKIEIDGSTTQQPPRSVQDSRVTMTKI